MKKVLIILLVSLVFMSCDFFMGDPGVDGLDGADGADGGNYPGGMLTILDDSGSADSNYKVQVVLDPDVNVLDGDEFMFSIDLGPYIIANEIDLVLPWYMADAVPGSYYIYAWVDIDGDGIIDDGVTGGPEESTLIIYDPLSDYTIDITSITGAVLRPNYTFYTEFAPEVSFSLTFSGF